jgi:hypothetical protein
MSAVECNKRLIIRGIYSSFFLLLGYFCIRVFEDVRNIQMVTVAVCQISIFVEQPKLRTNRYT